MRRSVSLIIFTFLLSTNVLADTETVSGEFNDLAVREARFIASRGQWFDALSKLEYELTKHRMSAAGKSAPSPKYSDQVESARIDFELSLRLYQRNGESILSGIKNRADVDLRNSFLFRLAKIYFQKGEPTEALKIVERINGDVSPEIAADVTFFRAQLLMANGRYSDAIAILDELIKTRSTPGIPIFNKRTQRLLGFAGYNLGIAHLLNGNIVEGRQQLDLAGKISSSDETALSVRDKANLLLGEQLLMDGRYEEAGLVLDRVRLEGPFSEQALLTAGWAAALQDNYKQALVPWTLLADRNITDAQVHEAMLAVPYSYGKLNVYSKAAPLYGQAVDSFSVEIDKLTESIASVREGRFLEALESKEIQYDPDWVVKLREQPDMPETYYLLDLLASNEFQAGLNNYLDLDQLRQKMISWQRDLKVYAQLIEKRRNYYVPLFPKLDRAYSDLESRIKPLLKRLVKFDRHLESIKKGPRPDLFLTEKEKTFFNEIDRIDLALKPYHVVKTRARVERLRGLLYWSMYTRYEKVLAKTTAEMQGLYEAIATMKEKQESYTFVRRAATKSFSGYKRRIRILRKQIKSALKNTEAVMSQQGKLLETMVETELVARLENLEEMQTKARFAMAESYDRASMKQNSGVGAR